MISSIKTHDYEIDGLSIVIRGNLNPAIFSPAWLFYQKLIGKEEFDNVEVELITSQIALFTPSWFSIQVTPDRLALTTVEPDEFERLRDLAVGILNLLPHTPIGALGINRDVHIKLESEADWHLVGDSLLPKEHWTMLALPGMRTISVEGVRPDLFAGRVVVQVEPSVRIENGIYMSHNDHFDLKRQHSVPKNRRRLAELILEQDEAENSEGKLDIALEVLNEGWNYSMTRAREAFAVVGNILRENNEKGQLPNG